MAATAAITGGMALGAGGQLLNAQGQSSANNANLQYMLQRQNMMQNYVNRMMQPGMNPFGQSILNFIGQGLPNGMTVGGFNPGAPQGAGAAAGSGGGGSAGGGASGNPNNPNGGTEITPNATLSPQGGYYAPSAGASPSAGGYPNIPGYSGGFTPALQGIGGIDISQYLGKGLRLNDLISQGVLSQAQVNQFMGNPAGYNPSADPGMQQQYQQWVQGMGLTPGANFGSAGPPSFQDWYNTFGQGGTNIDSFAPNNPAALQSALGQLPQTSGNGYLDASGNYVNPTNSPGTARYLQNGVMTDGSGNIIGYQGPNGLQSTPYTGQGGQGGAGGAGGMFSYQDPGAFTYNPATLGQAPTIGSFPQLQAQGIGAPVVQNPTMQAAQANSSVGFNPMSVQATGTQAFNAGQDALMQMMKRDLTPGQNPDLNANLGDLAGGKSQYNTTPLFGAIEQAGQRQLDQQLSQLHGQAGSLGQRFGSAMANTEAQTRANFAASTNLAEQNIGMQAFNTAQGMRQPALNTMADLLNQGNQFSLQNAAQQQSAASQLGGLGQAGTQLGLQAQLANQGTGLQAGLANQNLLAQLAQFNAGNQQQAGQLNAANFLQAQLANAGNQLQAGQFNAQQGLTAQQGNLQSAMQAALANQNVLAQYGTSNANILNQANQFNAGQRTGANQFAAQQGNIYNNFIMQALSQAAGLQSNQNSYNASLLGILNGVGVPQVQPSPWGNAIGDAGSSIALLPFLAQMMGNSSPAAYNQQSLFGLPLPS